MTSAFLRDESNLAEVIEHLAGKGVRLWVGNGHVSYRAPKGALCRPDIEVLKARKGEILALVQQVRAGTAASPVGGEAKVHLLPLSFSQTAHWRENLLVKHRRVTGVGFPTRWRGPLNVPALQCAFEEMIQRHEVLRSRIVVWDGAALQAIAEFGEFQLAVEDLSAVPADLQEDKVLDRISACMYEPYDVMAYPLFRFRLIRLAQDDHVLVMAMEHTITDGFSLDCFQQELFCLYQDIVRGNAPSLPAIALPFGEYVIRQRTQLPAWQQVHAQYWRERLKGCERLRFPVDKRARDQGAQLFSLLPIHFRNDLTEALREFSHAHRTTLVTTFLAGYVALVLRWCCVGEAVIRFQVDNRTTETERTLGYLASALYLKVSLRESDTFLDLLHRVSVEYSAALEHADFGYIEAQQPPPAGPQYTRFNWLQQPPAGDAGDTLDAGLDVSWFPFDREPEEAAPDEMDCEPTMGFIASAEELVGYLEFPLRSYSEEQMKLFSRQFVRVMEALLAAPDAPVASVARLSSRDRAAASGRG